MAPPKEEQRIQLSNSRFVTISQFKSQVRVDIREFYLTADGERKPGKKGISLSLDEWKKMKSQMKEIEEAIKAQGGDASESEDEKDDS